MDGTIFFYTEVPRSVFLTEVKSFCAVIVLVFLKSCYFQRGADCFRGGVTGFMCLPLSLNLFFSSRISYD